MATRQPARIAAVLGIVAVSLFLAVMPAPQVQAQVAGEIESFCPVQNGSEFGVACNDAYGATPVGSFYTAGDGNGIEGPCNVSTTCTVRLVNSEAVWQASSTSARAILEMPSYDFCNVAGAGNLQVGIADSPWSISFRVKPGAVSGTAIAGLGNDIQTNSAQTSAMGFFGLQFKSSDGSIEVVTLAGSTTTAVDITELEPYVLGDWYDVTISEVSCENNGEPVDEVNSFEIEVTHDATTVTYSGGGSGIVGSTGSTHMKQLNSVTAGPISDSGHSATMYIDNVQLLGVESAAVASASASVTDLVGFDVDPTGATAIARTNGGDYVRVYPGGSLGTPASKDTNCGGGGEGEFPGDGGVAAMASHVAYFDCDNSDDGEVIQLEIRSPSLSSPSRPPVCSDAGFCIEDIDTECGGLLGCIEGDQDDDTYIAIMEEFPIDYSRLVDGFFDRDRVYMAMAYADDSGNIGVWTYTMQNNGIDQSGITHVGIAGQAPDQICAHRDPDGTSYLYGSSTESNVRGFRITFSIQEDGTQLVPKMASVFAGSGSTAGAKGVACGDEKLAILNAGQLTIWNRTANGQSVSPSLTKTGLTSTQTRGVAMSANGLWTAYTSGGEWHLINNINGTEVASAALPSGTFRGIELNGCGGDLWVATSTTIERYAVFESTTGFDCIFNPILDPGDIDGDGVANKDDPDVDGDGLCNSGLPSQPLGTAGAINGCQGVDEGETACVGPNTPPGCKGDWDNDNDGLFNDIDTTPNGSGQDAGGSGLADDTLFAPFVSSFGLMLGGEVAGRIATTILIMFAIGCFLGARFGLGGLIFGSVTGFGISIAGTVFPKEWGLVVALLLVAGAVIAFFAGGKK